MAQPVVTVDAFTDRPFGGNPAAVCILPRPADERWMQSVAAEMNLSETAFVHPEDGGYRLRWFTPTIEIDLCGHATLASAHVLWESAQLTSETPARFHTRSGLLTASRQGDLIELDFPAERAVPHPAPAGLEDAIGAPVKLVARNRFDYLLEVADEAVLRSLRPDAVALRGIPSRGFILTCASARPEFDFVSRFFSAATGTYEDPVTGSAHCCLGPFWGERLGKSELVGYQASARGGVIRVRVLGERVILAGHAVTVMRGEILA